MLFVKILEMPQCVNVHQHILETPISIADLILALTPLVDKTQIVPLVGNVRCVDALEDFQETQIAGLVALLILVRLTILAEKVPNVVMSAADLYVAVPLETQEIHMLDVSKVLAYLTLNVRTTKLVRTIIVLTHVQPHVDKELNVVPRTM